jgi:ribosomal protein L10
MRETDEITREMLVEEKAKRERDSEIAVNSILAGLQNDLIAQITGLTIEQIQELRNAAKQ